MQAGVMPSPTPSPTSAAPTSTDLITNPDATPSSSPPPPPAPAPAASTSQREEKDSMEEIDALLAAYLTLLDEYTTLRAALHTHQATLFQQLARANYAAAAVGGGRRYGADYYDGRMQASRRVRVDTMSGGRGNYDGERDGGEKASELDGETTALNGKGMVGAGAGGNSDGGWVVKFAVVEVDPESQDGTGTQNDEADAGAKAEKSPISEGTPTHDAVDTNDDASETQEEKPQAKRKPHDPLRWFGILTPPALREAQRHAVTAVEEIIPQLATLSTEMARIELEVRRARKKRAKAAKAEQKRLLELEDKMGQVSVSA